MTSNFAGYSDDQNDDQNTILSLESLLSYSPLEYPTNILSRRIVLRIYYPVEYSVLNFISYLLKDMKLESLLFILYSNIISLEIVYPTGYPISFRLVREGNKIRINISKAWCRSTGRNNISKSQYRSIYEKIIISIRRYEQTKL